MKLHIIRRSICTNLSRPCKISLVPSVIKKSTKNESYNENKHGFVDSVRVQVKAGDGGNGGNTLLSVFQNEFAGPDGGNGGNGGHFLFKASKKVNSLGHLKVNDHSLFRKKRFMLNEMFQKNASKFAIFFRYENPHSFFISCCFIFSLRMPWLVYAGPWVYVNIDQDIN